MMKYLIRAHPSVGEIAFNIALMNTIARIDPDCHVEVLVKFPVNQLLEDTPYIDRIHLRPKSFISDMVLHLRLLRKNWDVVYIRGGGRLQPFYRFVKAKHKLHRAHFDYSRGNREMKHRWRFRAHPHLPDINYSYGNHEIELQLSMLDGILEGWNDLVDPTIHFNPKRTKKITDKLALDHNERCLSIAPGASHARKMWDKDKFVALGNTIGKSFDRILVLGSKNEHELCQYVANNIEGENLAGTMKLLDVVALLSLVSLHIGNDSGLGHLAASSKTNSLAIGDEIGPQKSPWQQHMILGDVKNISVEEVSNYLRDNNLIQSD